MKKLVIATLWIIGTSLIVLKSTGIVEHKYIIPGSLLFFIAAAYFQYESKTTIKDSTKRVSSISMKPLEGCESQFRQTVVGVILVLVSLGIILLSSSTEWVMSALLFCIPLFVVGVYFLLRYLYCVENYSSKHKVPGNE